MKLAVVFSDILGKSGRSILEAICTGEIDPIRLASKVAPNVRVSQEQLRAALTADLREHHHFLLRELLSLIDAQNRSITHLEQEIERHLAPFEEQISRCDQMCAPDDEKNGRLEPTLPEMYGSPEQNSALRVPIMMRTLLPNSPCFLISTIILGLFQRAAVDNETTHLSYRGLWG